MSLRHYALAFAALFTVTFVFADDDDKGNGKGKQGQRNPEEMFKRLDTNGNGRLTKQGRIWQDQRRPAVHRQRRQGGQLPRRHVQSHG